MMSSDPKVGEEGLQGCEDCGFISFWHLSIPLVYGNSETFVTSVDFKAE